MDADDSIGSDLAAVRLRHRIGRLERVLRELRRQAAEGGAETPVGLVRAMREFELELAATRDALAIARGESSA